LVKVVSGNARWKDAINPSSHRKRWDITSVKPTQPTQGKDGKHKQVAYTRPGRHWHKRKVKEIPKSKDKEKEEKRYRKRAEVWQNKFHLIKTPRLSKEMNWAQEPEPEKEKEEVTAYE
jgi:hypothetical protein